MQILLPQFTPRVWRRIIGDFQAGQIGEVLRNYVCGGFYRLGAWWDP